MTMDSRVSRIYRSGSSWLSRFGNLSSVAPRRISRLIVRNRRELDLRTDRGGRAFSHVNNQSIVFLAAAQRRRNFRQQLRPVEFFGTTISRLSSTCSTPLSGIGVKRKWNSGIVVHLSRSSRRNLSARNSAHRAAGADQRMVRHRQNRRHQDGAGLSTAVRIPRHRYDAHESLRARRSLRPDTSHVLPR